MTTLFHVSDLHFGKADMAALDWFAGLVAAERPAAVIVTGDLTMRARSAEYAAATEWLAALNVPLSIEVGNHDLPYFNPVKRLFHPYGRYARVEAALEKVLDLSGVTIVPLRTTSRAQWRFDWSLGVVHGHRLRAAAAAVEAAPAGDVVIVACHHPLNSHTRGGAAALAGLAAAGADVVLSGHVHDPFDEIWSAGGASIRIVGAGTLSERVRSTPPSFNELTVDGGELAVRVRVRD